MTKEEVRQALCDITVDILNCSESEVKDEVRIEDLGADSLDGIEILMEIEKEFGIYISDEEALRVVNCGDMLELVCQKVEAL